MIFECSVKQFDTFFQMFVHISYSCFTRFPFSRSLMCFYQILFINDFLI